MFPDYLPLPTLLCAGYSNDYLKLIQLIIQHFSVAYSNIFLFNFNNIGKQLTGHTTERIQIQDCETNFVNNSSRLD